MLIDRASFWTHKEENVQKPFFSYVSFLLSDLIPVGFVSFLSVKAEETASRLEHLADESRKINEDMKVLLRYSHIEKLTQDVVDVFVKRVAVYKDKRVEIEWNFNVD